MREEWVWIAVVGAVGLLLSSIVSCERTVRVTCYSTVTVVVSTMSDEARMLEMLRACRGM